MSMGYHNLRKKMHIITVSKASNFFFIPEIIMIHKDKSFLYVSMHMMVRMYTCMVQYQQTNDLRHRALGLCCTYSRRLKWVGSKSGWQLPPPYTPVHRHKGLPLQPERTVRKNLLGCQRLQPDTLT